MKKIFIPCLFVFLISSVSVGFAHNPFTSKPEKGHKVLTSPVKGKFFIKIVFWQHQLREKMSQLIREAKSEKKFTPLLLLALFSFLYGVIHSAGPGHGKAVALSYILTCKPSLSQSLLFGNFVALTHGFSGIALVLCVKFILHTRITGSMDLVTYTTQIISFSLISLMGIFIVTRGVFTRFKKEPVAGHKQTRVFAAPFATAFAVGLVPCPGVVMVMLFSMSLNLTGLGIFLGTCIALGMASTITLIVIAGMSGKSAILKLSGRHDRLQGILETVIEIAAGLMVAALGLILLLANL